MEIANSIMKEAKEDVEDLVHPLDRQFAGLGMAEMAHRKSSDFFPHKQPLIAAVDPKATEFQELQDYLLKSHGSTHYFRFQVNLPPLSSSRVKTYLSIPNTPSVSIHLQLTDRIHLPHRTRRRSHSLQ